ncbi:MAG: hypothetical protein AB7K52_14060 [Phycisphaerales bacterium]
MSTHEEQPAQPVRVGGAAGQGLQQFACAKCGAKLEFLPGSRALRCPYCAHENAIPASVDDLGDARRVEELDFEQALSELRRLGEGADTRRVSDIECGACKAIFLPAEGITATRCPFCATNIVLTAHVSTAIKPGSVLPFGIRREEAVEKYRDWIRSRWFAPNALRSRAMLDAALQGLYVPAWTYDANTTTRYTGERGDAYYVTVGSGKNRRRVRRVRWSSVSGVVSNTFDDVLVMATRSLPEKHLQQLEPWDLHDLVPYEDSFLAGFTAEAYAIDLPGGFEAAKGIMAQTIHATICADIGGDEQRVSSTQTTYRNVRFKHLLLPVWMSAYRFGERTFRFLVNARTGEVQGERPYSWIKITLAVLAGLVAITLIVLAVRAGS